MRKLFLFLFMIPFFTNAQDESKDKEVSIEEVKNIFDSLPKENGQVRWFEDITLDSSYAKDILNENAEAVFSRILSHGREITRIDGKKDGKISGIGTFNVDGGSQNTLLGHVDESRDIDFTLEILFRNGSYSFRVSEVTSIRERKTSRNSDRYQNTEFDQLTLEQAYKACSKSSSKKLERRAFYQTIQKLKYDIELLKLIMAKRV